MAKLPEDILKKRVSQEIALAKRKLTHIIAIEGGEINDFPVKLIITLVDIPGPVWRSSQLEHKKSHQFEVTITDSYPYEKPIVKWESEIFHPNIKLPGDGGDVCTRLLDGWGFHSNMVAFIKGIESLLTNPNPRSPWGTDSCTTAAQYFNTHDYDPPGDYVVNSGPQVVRGS